MSKPNHAKAGIYQFGNTVKRIFKSFTLVVLLVTLLVTFAILWATTTTAGTKYTLGLMGHYAGFHIQGISGSLAHQLKIRHIDLQSKEMDLVADDVELQWQPGALLDRQIQLDYIRINNLQLASSPSDNAPATLPKSLKLPQVIKLIVADELVVNYVQISTLEPDRKHSKSQQFSALKARLSINPTAWQYLFSGTTPWGSAMLQGNIESEAPFAVRAQFDWRGLAIKQSGVSFPMTQLRGALSGNLKKLFVNAKLNVESASTQTNDVVSEKRIDNVAQNQLIEPASGQFHAILTPFDILPLDTLQLDLNSVNPVSFYADAPKAKLQIKADFKVTADIKSPTLHGQLAIKNAIPMTWNTGGIPISSLTSELTFNAHQLTWHSLKMNVDDGLVTGTGSINLTTDVAASNKKTNVLTKPPKKLPVIAAWLEVKNMNLLRLDNRLKQTQLNGKIQVDSVKAGLQLGLQLHDTQKNLNANLAADVLLSHDHVINIQKIELIAKDATLSAQGSFALRGKQAFSLQGEAYHMNPAHWINVPEGRIATQFTIAGQLQEGWLVDVHVANLTGQFAGLDLNGKSTFFAQQGKLLSIKNLELNWGKSYLSASGHWQLSEKIREQISQNKQDQPKPDPLRLKLVVPDLGALSRPFKKIIPIELSGSVFANGILSGNVTQPSGHLHIQADKLAIPGIIALEKLNATVALEEGAKGKVEGNVDLTGLVAGVSDNPQNQDGKKENEGFKVNHLQASLVGLRHAHQLKLTATLPRKYQVSFQAQGDLQETGVAKENSTIENGVQWKGQVQQLNLSGALDLQLVSPFALQASVKSVQMGSANWQGTLGKLRVQQVNWTPGQLKSTGQLQGLSVASALKLWRNNFPLIGNLQIDATWKLDIGQQLAGQFEIKRTSGDVVVQDIIHGNSQTFALGMQNLYVKGRFGGAIANAEQIMPANLRSQPLNQPINIQLLAHGEHLGQIEANFNSVLSRVAQGWSIAANAPISGMAKMQINNIQWLSQLLSSGVALQGELQAQAQLAGTLENPDYSAKISGKELQVSLPELGVLLPHGVLDASIKEGLLKLNNLAFSQTIKLPPKHPKLTELTWINETGHVESSGTIDLHSGRGSITTRWQHFPFLQSADSWLVASGEAYLTESEKTWDLTGQLLADAAYFSVPKQAPPKLSGDVVILKKNAGKHTMHTDKPQGFQSNVDFTIKTGKNFVFVGRGLNTVLRGDLRIRIQNDSPVLATGSIQTAGGTYEGYGQQLTIERGILNFQGALDNPGLNVRALRKGLPVEAGVDVVGTVAKPEVRLISEPNVPDQDKLSWMVLGRPSDQMAGSEAALLMGAASAILGGDSGNSIPNNIAHTFGLDSISVSTASTTPGSQLPGQTVAGTISNTTPNDQVFSVGKRITPNLIFSIERSLTDATNGIKLTWQLTRYFSLVGRTGSDTSIDGQYTFSFN